MSIASPAVFSCRLTSIYLQTNTLKNISTKIPRAASVHCPDPPRMSIPGPALVPEEEQVPAAHPAKPPPQPTAPREPTARPRQQPWMKHETNPTIPTNPTTSTSKPVQRPHQRNGGPHVSFRLPSSQPARGWEQDPWQTDTCKGPNQSHHASRRPRPAVYSCV